MVKVKSLSGEFVIGYLTSFYYDYIEDFYYLNGITFDPYSVKIYNEK